MICSARLCPGVGYIQVCLTLPVCARAYRCIREAFNPTLTPTGAPFIATSHGNRRGTVECLCTSICFFSPLQGTPWWCIFGPRTLKHGFPTAACFQACWIIPASRLDETFCSTTRAFRCDRAGRAKHTARETELREMRLHPPVPRAPLSLALECMRHA